MNIKTLLLEEHSKAQTNKIVTYVQNDGEKFEELMQLFFTGELLVQQRAAWAVSYCFEKHPQLIHPYIDKLIKNLNRKNLHDAVKRNTLRILQNIVIPENESGALLNKCYEYILSANEPPAIKAFSLTVIENICFTHPDLFNEFYIVVEELVKHSSFAAIISRCKHILQRRTKGISKIKNHQKLPNQTKQNHI